jgi:hypothetical protein
LNAATEKNQFTLKAFLLNVVREVFFVASLLHERFNLPVSALNFSEVRCNLMTLRIDNMCTQDIQKKKLLNSDVYC